MDSQLTLPNSKPEHGQQLAILRVDGEYTLEELQDDLEFVLPPRTTFAIEGKLGMLTKKAVEFRLWYTQLAHEACDRSEELQRIQKHKARLESRRGWPGRSVVHDDRKLKELEQDIKLVKQQQTIYVSMALKFLSAYRHITDRMEFVGFPIFWPEPSPNDTSKKSKPKTGQWVHLLKYKYEWRT